MRNNKLIISAFITASILISCNVPEDRRATTRKKTSQFETDLYSQNSARYHAENTQNKRNESTENKNTTSKDTNTVVDDNSSSIPNEINHCQWSEDGQTGFSEGSSYHLNGLYSICQSSNDNSSIYLQVQRPNPSTSVCIIPTHNNGNKSVYIGEPRCRVLSDSKKIYKIQVFKNRAGYQNLSITGVMIIRDEYQDYGHPFNQRIKAPDAYIFCSEYLDQYGDPSYCQTFQRTRSYQYKLF